MIDTIKLYASYDTCLAYRLELKIENPFGVILQIFSICAISHNLDYRLNWHKQAMWLELAFT
jgi:hypothetical protein